MTALRKFFAIRESFDGKDAKKKGFNTTQPILPNHISGRILDLEMECQKQTVTKLLVSMLTRQYTKAIQFYDQQGNQKYKIYKRRMQNFLSRPHIQLIMSGEQRTIAIRKQLNQEIIKNEKSYMGLEIREIIERENKKKQKQQNCIKQQQNAQNNVLQQKIRRKRIMSSQSKGEKKCERGVSHGNYGRNGENNMQVLLGSSDEKERKEIIC